MKIERIKLLNTLRAVMPGVAKREEIVQQSAAFLFANNRIYTYNDIAAVSIPFESGLTVSVRAMPLIQLLEKLEELVIDISLVEGGFHVAGTRTIASIASEAELRLDLPELIGTPSEWVRLPKEFLTALGLCMLSIRRDTNRLSLNCVNMTENWMQSTDMMRASRWVFSEPWVAASKLGILLIPRSACAELSDYEPTSIAVTNGWLHFQGANDVTYACRQIADEYPDLNQIFTSEEGRKIVFPAELLAALDRTKVMAEADKAADAQVMITAKESWLYVLGQGPFGWVKERVALARPVDPAFSFNIHPTLLGAMLQQLDRAIVYASKIKLVDHDGHFEHVIALFMSK